MTGGRGAGGSNSTGPRSAGPASSGRRRGSKGGSSSVQRPWPLEQRPGFLIRRLHQIHGALFQAACAAFEITPLQYSLLSALAVRKIADQTTLAADIALDRTTTTGALKRLAARHLVERAVDEVDRRSRACQLTPAGARLLAEIEPHARAAHHDTIAPLSAAERKLFLALMQRIVAVHVDDDTAPRRASGSVTLGLAD